MRAWNDSIFLFFFFIVLSGCGSQGGDPALPLDADLSTEQQAWSTGVAPDAPNGSHQWLFSRGLAILRKHADLPGVGAKLAWLDTPECLAQVRQGLFDPDFLHQYTGGRWDLTPETDTFGLLLAGATFAAHFYDPDTGKTYNGKDSPTADEMVRDVLQSSRTAGAQSQLGLACHELGVAAHFMGDVAQPMHAALFPANRRPLYLHTNLERYVMDLQDGYEVDDWDATPQGSLEDLIQGTAKSAKALWPDTMASVWEAYQERGCWTWMRIMDNPSCWQGHPALDAWLGQSLRDAELALARFLYLADFGPAGDLSGLHAAQ